MANHLHDFIRLASDTGAWFTGFNPKAVEHIRRGLVPLAVAVSMARPGGVAVQAGACHGLYPVALARTGRFSAVLSFEVMPENFVAAVANAADDPDVYLAAEALGEITGECHVKACEGNPGGSGLVPKDRAEATRPMTTIDEEADGEDVTLIQLDIEGSEWPAILGGVETIERCRPVIQLEVAHDDSAAQWLLGHGYRRVYANESDVVLAPRAE